MIGQKHRFHGHNSLNYVYSNGRTVRAQELAIRFADNPRRKDYRCAVVVSKKISKSAVTRNRIRRRIYEIIRQFEGQIQGTPDIVVTIYTDAVASMPADELQKTVQSLLKNSGLIG